MAAKWSLARRELPGYPTVIATLQYTGIPEQCPPPSWAFKHLSISYESTDVSMLSAMSHLSLSNLMKWETSKMTLRWQRFYCGTQKGLISEDNLDMEKYSWVTKGSEQFLSPALLVLIFMFFPECIPRTSTHLVFYVQNESWFLSQWLRSRWWNEAAGFHLEIKLESNIVI